MVSKLRSLSLSLSLTHSLTLLLSVARSFDAALREVAAELRRAGPDVAPTSPTAAKRRPAILKKAEDLAEFVNVYSAQKARSELDALRRLGRDASDAAYSSRLARARASTGRGRVDPTAAA